MKTVEHLIDNGAGWLLSLSQSWDPARLVPGRRPILIVPGYGMNSFIFSYHPRGLSLEGFLTAAGFEVWRVDLRGQGRSRATFGTDSYGLEDLALVDLPKSIDAALERTRTEASRADVIGASLGGSLMLAHAALCPEHRMGALVAMGSPVRWRKVHPLLRIASSAPVLLGLIPIRGTRKIFEWVMPHVVRRVPWLLSAYINPDVTDLDAAREMVKTVEDPNRHVNRQIARWIQDGDLILGGRNVAERLPQVRAPLLCVLASNDGIVPRETALFPWEVVSSTVKTILEVGSQELAIAHADLFVSNAAHERVFTPIAAWLEKQPDVMR